MTDLIKLLEELLSLGSYPLNPIADPLVNKILSHPACNAEITKQVKQAVQREVGWLFCGLDFASLEDRISGLTTKDPNKLKVYAGSKQFDVTVNGITHRICEEDVVKYDGKELNGSELYEKLQGSKPRDVRRL